MKLHEYQAKRVFAEHGIPTPNGQVTADPGEAKAIAQKLGGRAVVKAQVPIGGRGKAGAIKFGQTPDEVADLAKQILAMDVRGYPVDKVLIEGPADIAQEYYLSVTLDRARSANVIIASASGGMEIEELAETQPDKIVKVWLDAALGLRDFNVVRVLTAAGFPSAAHEQIAKILRAIYDIAVSNDAVLVEINPLVLTGDGHVIALDGKMEIDDNAIFRQGDVLAKVGQEQERDADEHPLEARAKEKGLAYVKVDGNVGIIGNGAGLVMTTLDMIQRYGGRPANFLDIGGGASAEVVQNALDIVLADEQVQSILINVFGGITRGDEVAKGLLSVVGQVKPRVPIVVRLAGTRAQEGREILEGSPLIPAATFQEAAQKAVELAQVS